MFSVPVASSVKRAEDGVSCAGKFFAVSGVLFAMEERVFQLGPMGTKKIIKAVINLLGAVKLAALGECYRFASALGVDMEKFA
ncbi:hypothetical protein [Mailhella massiliensis]|uniref:Uncharacterized protein n=1 Tax=Mailhella massiliensis TaxID=1903261 RepID=A0A921AWH5_9BACT|nr:hypothetical protein [Mailhella massiliensis]HJD97117.1 hypothetical protein [Mailhella massiliensis]